MSVTGPCAICSYGEAEYTCMRCGQLVCEKHFDKRTDRCEECTGEVGEHPENIPSGEDMPDDVDTYQF